MLHLDLSSTALSGTILNMRAEESNPTDRMARTAAPLAAMIAADLTDRFGPDGLLRRLVDPAWFQPFGSLLGFDPRSSRVTLGALEALRLALEAHPRDLGIALHGGKLALHEESARLLEEHCRRSGLDPAPLIRISRLSVKADSLALLDGFELYLHVFIVTADGQWAVIQQGVDDATGRARRYHWLGAEAPSLTYAPHRAIACDIVRPVIDLSSPASDASRAAIVELSRMAPQSLAVTAERACHPGASDQQTALLLELASPDSAGLRRDLHHASPRRFEELLEVDSLTPRAVEALALLAELLFDVAPSRIDPVTHGLAHGLETHRSPIDARPRLEARIGELELSIASASLRTTRQLAALEALDAFARDALTAARGDPEIDAEASQLCFSFDPPGAPRS